MSASSNLIAYVGTYASTTNTSLIGGVHTWSLSVDRLTATPLQHVKQPGQAGYITYAAEVSTLYVVDERKTDGRGPVSAPAAVHALAVDSATGELTWINSQLSPGPNPTFLDYSPKHNALFSANHGDFEHVERVVLDASGSWTTEYVYDDSTVIQYSLSENGTINGLQDVVVLQGHGIDPNGSPQQSGHAQASPHAHSASLDPSESFLVVGDKGTDQIHVYRVGSETLELAYTYNSTNVTAPRHVAWPPVSTNTNSTGSSSGSNVTHFFMTFELSSEVASFELDQQTGTVTLLDVVSSIAANSTVYNEPADIQVHPTNSRLIYVNNRGEDTVAWFTVDDAGKLTRAGSVSLTVSDNPGVAARSFRFTPAGDVLLVADRPANAVRSYSVNQETGSLEQIAFFPISEPAFICIVRL